MSRLKVQRILEGLPVLPAGLYPNDLDLQLARPRRQRNGFEHSTGEWQFIYIYDGKQYRLPESLAVAMMNTTSRRFQ